MPTRRKPAEQPPPEDPGIDPGEAEAELANQVPEDQQELYPEGGEADGEEHFEIGDELPLDENGDPDMDAMLQGADRDFTGDPEADEIIIDWNPEKNLVPVGMHPAVVVSIKPDKTNPQDGSQPKNTLRWTVKLLNDDYPFERDKNIPLAQGKGIERKHVEYAAVFGYEVQQREDGTMALSLSKLREAAVGQHCLAEIEHRPDRNDKNRIWDSLKDIHPWTEDPLG